MKIVYEWTLVWQSLLCTQAFEIYWDFKIEISWFQFKIRPNLEVSR